MGLEGGEGRQQQQLTVTGAGIMTSPLARPSLTILLHDDGGDDVFERLVQPCQLLDACLQAAGGPLAHLRGGRGGGGGGAGWGDAGATRTSTGR